MPFLRAPIREQRPHLAGVSVWRTEIADLDFAAPVHLPPMTVSNRKLFSRLLMGSISEMCTSHQALVKTKYPLFSRDMGLARESILRPKF